jgi:hypothetical protein
MVLWLGLAIVNFSVADPESGLTFGSSYIFVAFGTLMLVLSVHSGFEYLKDKAEEGKRKVAEEIL